MTSTGVFAYWQPQYAEQGIATFPVNDNKRPSVKRWNTIGLRGSAKLATRFPHSIALGFQLGPHSGVTVLDVDTQNEGLVEEAFNRHGPSPFIVRTGGGYHAYYRHGGERRHIRPYADQPIDILGGGFVVAPPSMSAKGRYEIIRGSLDDLASLPPIHVVLDSLRRVTAPIPEGRRDSTLFRQLLREARHCDDFDTLLDVARSVNMNCIPPMTDAQVVKTAKSAWGFEISGNNWVGRKARASTDREEILAFSHDPAAAMLLMLLRVSHPRQNGDSFAIDQVKTSELLGWSRETTRARITALMKAGHIQRVHYGKGKGDPHLYRLTNRVRASDRV